MSREQPESIKLVRIQMEQRRRQDKKMHVPMLKSTCRSLLAEFDAAAFTCAYDDEDDEVREPVSFLNAEKNDPSVEILDGESYASFIMSMMGNRNAVK